MKALIIDDEDDIRLIAQLGLQASGLTVVVAMDGREGAELAREHQPDIIVLDWMMPGMDGRATLAALRADASTARIPVVILTAKNLASAEDDLRGLGVVDFVSKPFAPRELVRRVKAALTRKSLPE